MTGSNWKLRSFVASAALVACAGLSTAEAQWFLPVGASPPQEIAQRLLAKGYVLIGPLQRRDTVYLADVNAGSAGRERLVIDAWSGEILQRFVAHRRYARSGSGGYVVEGGEFDSPPPLGPPPMRDFFNGPPGNGNVAYGGPPDTRIPATVGPAAPRLKVKSRPAATSHRPEETKPATAALPPAQSPPGADANGSQPSGPPAPAGAPGSSQQPSAPANAEASPPPSPSPEPEKGATKPNAPPAPVPAVAETQPKDASRPAAATPPSAPAPVAKPAAKHDEKSRVNDVPVNPLD
jgi:hypothetical protein